MATRRKILVVEDDDDLREILKDTLEIGGFDVTTAVDGYDAVIKSDRVSYSLMLTDIRLPKLSGLEVARIIQSRPRPTKIILITAYPVWQFEEELKELRVDAVLSKPFDLVGLIRTIEEILDGPDDTALDS